MAKRRKGGLSARECAGLRVAITLSLPGYAISLFLLLNHLAVTDASFCAVGGWASCNIVNRSPYSEILGVPVALMGVAGFLAVAVFATARLYAPRSRLGRTARPALSAAAVAGLAAGTYLTAVELFVLQLVCLLCAISFALFIATVVALRASLLLPRRGTSGRPRGQVPADQG